MTNPILNKVSALNAAISERDKEIERLRARVAELEAERKAFRDGNKYEAAP